jgi:hypothetical protein
VGPKPLPVESLQQYKASEEAKDGPAAGAAAAGTGGSGSGSASNSKKLGTCIARN